MSSLDELDDDYTKKKASYDNLPTFKREMTERYDTVNMILVIIFFLKLGASSRWSFGPNSARCSI